MSPALEPLSTRRFFYRLRPGDTFSFSFFFAAFKHLIDDPSLLIEPETLRWKFAYRFIYNHLEMFNLKEICHFWRKEETKKFGLHEFTAT